MATSAILVLTHLPDRDAALGLARALLAERLAACVNIGAPVESMYHWRGQIETAHEVPVAIKTRALLYSRVEAAIRASHPYELPEIVAVPLTHGSSAYTTGSLPKPLRVDPASRRWFCGVAATWLCLGTVTAGAAGAELLPAEEAFRFSARALDDRTLEARFVIADGYYLYRDKISFAVSPEGPVLGATDLPAGKVKTDQFFGKVETYRGTVVVRLPLAGAAAGQAIVLAADSQGCADVGVCYPPTRQKVTLPLPGAGAGPGALVDANPPRKSWFK